MQNTKFHPYKPKDFEKWLTKYRKVAPEKPSESRGKVQKNETESVRSAAVNTAGLENYAGDWGELEVRHLLSRCLFGFNKEQILQYKQLGLEGAISYLLRDKPLPSPPVNDYNGWNDFPDDPSVDAGETWIYAPEHQEYTVARIVSLKSWLVGLSSSKEASLTEKMVMFLQTLIPTLSWSVFFSRASYQYLNLLFKHSLGNYKVLVSEITKDPAMLLFLNGAFNNKYSPDENYARELQELFSLGKGSGSQYTEEDIRSAARVLTGWTIDWNDWEKPGEFKSFYKPDLHDENDKQFSTFFNDHVIVGRSGAAGANETDELIDMIFDQEESSKYICRRIYNFFVYPEIDETTEQNVIEPLAEIFRNSDFELKPVLETLFKSAHFFESSLRGTLIKSPAEFLIGTLSMFDHDKDLPNSLRLRLDYNSNGVWNMAGMGMEFCDPPNVAGWPAYYQAPQYDRSWISTDTIVKRARLLDAAVFWGYWINEEVHPPFDLTGFVKKMAHPEDVFSLVDEFNLLLLGGQMQNDNRETLLDILLSGTGNPGYWTQAWFEFLENPEDEGKRGVIENRLKLAFQQIFQFAEFQLF